MRSIRKDDLHTDYDPVGHTIHIASRMETIAAPSSILVSESTHKLAQGYFEFKTWELSSSKASASRSPEHLSGRQTSALAECSIRASESLFDSRGSSLLRRVGFESLSALRHFQASRWSAKDREHDMPAAMLAAPFKPFPKRICACRSLS